MKAQAQRVCPLFGRQIPRVQIQPGKEGSAAENLIVRLIQAERPYWPEEDRASRDGWESFAPIWHVIDFFEGFWNNRCLGECPTRLLAPQYVTNILWLDFEQYSVPIRRSVVNPCAR